jgi:drug/metabolite transporter (DMT)-like permease
MYSYVQPIVACVVSVIAGLGIFGWGQSFATVLIFVGVYLVIMSKSRSEMNSEAVKKE